MKWKRVNYLVHRWIGIGLGALVFTWFASGIVMIYYPWPAPTESATLGRLEPFDPPAGLVPVSKVLAGAKAMPARGVAASYTGAGRSAAEGPSGARLMRWDGRLVYSVWRLEGHTRQPVRIVDARTGEALSPLSPEQAVGVARSVVGPRPPVRDLRLFEEGDHYLLSAEYDAGFPAYRVGFGDAAHTDVYVSRRAGYVVGTVTDRTRWTTWLGTVPHWLYFKWLYHRLSLWLWVSYVLPSIAVVAGLTGIVLGTYQLFPRRRRGEWRVSSYHGLSKWHHIAGIVFGLLVVTWSLSGVLEVLGPDNTPTAAQMRRAAGPGPGPDSPPITVSEAARAVAGQAGDAAATVAVDVEDADGRPGYLFHLRHGREVWVDGASGRARWEMTAPEAVAAARRALGAGDSIPILGVTRITKYDAYYYARAHREMHLPAWRVAFGDRAGSVLYLDTVSGWPTGYVDTEVRWYRWLRDGLHSLDFPGLVTHTTAWELVVLILMLGGTVSAATGLWLAGRRVVRMR